MKSIFYALSTLLVLGILSAALAKAPATAKIVFTSNREGNFEIYIMNPDGSEQMNLTEHRADDYDPVWSPTGQQILFVSDRHGMRDLYLMNADGTNVRKVFQKLVGREYPTWSPDGKQFTYHRFNKLAIYVASSDGHNEEKLTNGLWPAWSPEGSEIAFVADDAFVVAADRHLQAKMPRIQIINLQTEAEEVLLPGKNLMFDPAWAPDSTQIAFSWIDIDAIPIADLLAGKDVRNAMKIYLVKRDGSGLREIADADKGATSNPTWSPRGNELIYVKRIREVRQIFRIAAEGGIPQQLTRQGDNFGGDWFDFAELCNHFPLTRVTIGQFGINVNPLRPQLTKSTEAVMVNFRERIRNT